MFNMIHMKQKLLDIRLSEFVYGTKEQSVKARHGGRGIYKTLPWLKHIN